VYDVPGTSWAAKRALAFQSGISSGHGDDAALLFSNLIQEVYQ
jgi:hypothetical protein